MVILKTGTGTVHERDVEIVNPEGTWHNGDYQIYSVTGFLPEHGKKTAEPHDVNSPNFLGQLNIQKDAAVWLYQGDKLNADEQKEIAEFIIDYTAPDAVY